MKTLQDRMSTKFAKIEYEFPFAGHAIDDDDKLLDLPNGRAEEYIVKKAILQENFSI